MKKFILKAILFSLLFLTPVVGYYLKNRAYLAAQKVTNSYSFNEKLKWLPVPNQTDILAIGSSMSLNNISTEIVTDCFHDQSYLNLSSWGLSFQKMSTLLPLVTELYAPKKVIVFSNVFEFHVNEISLDTAAIRKALLKNREISPIDLFFSRYYRKRTKNNRTYYETDKTYASLKFDQHGGVNLAAEEFEIKENRWNEPLLFTNMDTTAYDYLNSIAETLREQGIELILAHTPVRTHLITEEYRTTMAEHTGKVNAVLTAHQHRFVDLSLKELPDSCFVDFAHLNKRGADLVTQEVLSQAL